jgi:hypothetical protein
MAHVVAYIINRMSDYIAPAVANIIIRFVALCREPIVVYVVKSEIALYIPPPVAYILTKMMVQCVALL